ncbi:MAG: hypothetical protein ABIJ48_10955 [Actinomycetota bacterium]
MALGTAGPEGDIDLLVDVEGGDEPSRFGSSSPRTRGPSRIPRRTGYRREASAARAGAC